MFDVVIRLNEQYFAGAIDTELNVFVTSEDATCFETVDRLVRNEIGLMNKPEVIFRLENRAYTIKRIEGFNPNEIKSRLIIDGSLLEFAAKTDYIKEIIVEAITATDGFVLTTQLEDTIDRFQASIEAKSDYWGEHREPMYPLECANDGAIGVDENFILSDTAIVKTGVREEVISMPNPYTIISFPIATAQNVIRAYSEKLKSTDYMLQNVAVQQTSEFGDEYSDEDEDEDDVYRISTRELVPNFSQLIAFKYYVPNLITDQNLIMLAKEAVDSVYYRQNLKTLNPQIRANNECFQYIIGSDTIADKVNPNEIYMKKALQCLLMDLIMYEYNVYNIEDVLGLGFVRSKMFDSYLLDLIQNVMVDNFAYTGKSLLSVGGGSSSDDDDAPDDSSVALFGYKKTVFVDGRYVNTLSEDDWLLIKDNIQPDGTQRVDKYLKGIVNSFAYGEMFLYMLRFGQTKSRYIKVSSEEPVDKPYFDTLKFESIQQPNIIGKFTPVKTESGKDFYLEGSVYLKREFPELYDRAISLPIAVVLRKPLVSAVTTKSEYVIVDIAAFCSVVYTPVNGELPYSIEGISIEDGKPIAKVDFLRDTASKKFSIEDVHRMLNSEEESCVIGTTSRLIKLINKLKLDAGIKSMEPLNIYEAYKQVEDFRFTYEDTQKDFTPADCATPKDYVYKKVMKDLLEQMINKTLSADYRQVDAVDLVLERQHSLVHSDTKSDSDKINFYSLLEKRTLSCKMIRKEDEAVMGYLFQSKHEDKTYMLIASVEDIGLSLPSDSTWRAYPFEKILESVIKPYQRSTDKVKFIREKESKGMYFVSDNTINLLAPTKLT